MQKMKVSELYAFDRIVGVVVESRDTVHMLLLLLPTTSSGITIKLFEEDAP